MTDEDDRMDRARRIREMREGGRSNDGEESAAQDEGETTDGETSASAEVDEDDADAATMHIPGADVGDIEVDIEEMARKAGLESAGDADGDDTSDDANTAESVSPTVGMSARARTQETSEETRVLEFSLADEKYCLDIEYIEEIVKEKTITRVPNTPRLVEGVVDLRGQITTILDPKVPLDIDREAGTEQLIVVFDPEAFEEQGAIGWIVDDVNQVLPITDDDVNASPMEQDHINGVIERDEEFVIWASPKVTLEDATG